MDYNKAKELLEKYGQEQLLRYYDELNDDRKASLLKQIEGIDFSLLDLIKENSEAKKGVITPLDSAVTIEDIEKNKEKYTNIGISAIKEGKVGALLLAGGMGTRLGSDKPKGMYNIGLTKDVYIFEMLINNLMDVVNQSGTWVPLYIMTSEKNNDDTIKFFEEKNYFGYNKDYVDFFVQEMAPASTFDGKIYLEEKGKVSTSPNGNGGWFISMVKAGLCEKAKKQGVEYINIFAVDNVCQRMADPCFVGAMIKNQYPSAAKVVKKANPEERVGVLCYEDGKPSIVEYYDLPYRYNQTVVKVLAQTPTNLFVYWDIADSDREIFKKEYGYDFFDKTRPVLIVHNETMNYAFEVDINDFANSWYLHVNDANCDYKIELGRKPIYNYVQREVGELEQKDLNSDFNKYPSKPIDKDYFYVTISNDIDAPNNHILAEDYNKPINSVLIRNVKSNTEYTKNIDNLPISKYLNNLFNIQDIYKKLFEENTIKDFYDLSNPSSGNPSSGSFSSQFK